MRAHDRQVPQSGERRGVDPDTAAAQAMRGEPEHEQTRQRDETESLDSSDRSGAATACSGTDNGGDLMNCSTCGDCRDSECPCLAEHREKRVGCGRKQSGEVCVLCRLARESLAGPLGAIERREVLAAICRNTSCPNHGSSLAERLAT